MPNSSMPELSAPMIRYFNPASSEAVPRAEIADENIEADRQRLERDEQHHEVIALREQHHRRPVTHQHDVVEFDSRHRLASRARRRASKQTRSAASRKNARITWPVSLWCNRRAKTYRSPASANSN